MKNKFKIIALLAVGTLGSTVFAQAPVQTAQPSLVTTTTTNGTKIEIPADSALNDYSSMGEGNIYEKAVTPLLREISKKKTILELKKLDKEIEKLDEVDKKTPGAPGGFVPMPSAQQAPSLPMQPMQTMQNSGGLVFNPVKILMTYGDDEDLYAKIAVGDQGGYTVRKGDILPDGRTVVKVSSHYIEVQKESAKKVKSKSKSSGKVEKIFISAPIVQEVKTVAPQAPIFNGMPNVMPLPSAKIINGTN